jgi:TonB-dependent SusC/RagA subfamily outer membrane receptor
VFLFLINQFIGTGNFAAAQQRTVCGTITDHEGQFLAGVTVMVKGTTVRNLSDAFGKYSLSNVDPDAVISFSLNGKITREVLLNGQASVSVSLVNSVIVPKEIVIVGYNTQTKKNLPDTVSNVQTNDLTRTKQGTVSGTITDQKGELLAGVNVMVKGTTIGTISDVFGKYSLPNVALDAVISFSFDDMTILEIPLNGHAFLSVSLPDSAFEPNEIVNVGYGTETKKTLTGAVSSVQSRDLERTHPTTISQALAGKMSGVAVRTSKGSQGISSSIRIHNYGTPLYIIDGVPSTESDFNCMDIENVENISILKDGSTAIYGFQGSNGVVLVTTKRGK